MIIGLLADIHANALALEAVLKSAKNKGAEQLLIAGDLIGYYFEPLKVMDMLEPWSKTIIRGNHEDYLAQALASNAALADYEARYGSGIGLALEQLDEERLHMLTTLPHPLEIEIDGYSILLSHGAPWDNDYYVYPDAESAVLEKFTAGKHDLMILGHTHYPMRIAAGGTKIVNPGSVGQPRNRKPGAHWATFDTRTGNLNFHVEAYNPENLVAECQSRHPDLTYLSEVLTRT